MKFQWTLIRLHWFILTADLWNFNFLFILRLLEMESLCDNWLQWMEMIWSVLKQMGFALRGFAVTIPIWLGLDFWGWSLRLHACFLFSQHWNIQYLYCGAAAWPLNILPSLYAKYSILTHWEDIHSLYVSCRLCWPSASVDALLNCIHLTDCRCREGFSQTVWQVTNAITLEWTSACAVYLSPPFQLPLHL